MKNTSFFLIIVSFLFAFYSCKDNLNLNTDELKNSEVRFISDDELEAIANKHNEFLEEIIINFDFGGTNNYLELKHSFLISNLENLTLDKKEEIISKIENKHIRGDSIVSLRTTNDLVIEIQNASFSNKDQMIEFIQNAESKIMDDANSYAEIKEYIDKIVVESNQILESNEQLVVNSYLFTLKASAYFWLPSNFGYTGPY